MTKSYKSMNILMLGHFLLNELLIFLMNKGRYQKNQNNENRDLEICFKF